MRIVYIVIFVLASLFVSGSTVLSVKRAGDTGYEIEGLSKAGFLGKEFSKLILGVVTAYISVLLLDLAIQGLSVLFLRWF